MADTIHFANAPADAIGETDIILSDVFHSQNTMREKNRNLMLTLHRFISANQIQAIKEIMNHDSLSEFHPSLLKSILIITKQVEDIQPERERVENLLQQKI